ncbi:uncharacterized protein MELLADRAFT_109233 [Melampsora larici-populina 98AG31]|uniref:Retrotransposon Copia-like N-terminal domain-containing protein n=1 Tax=Melampsora larici-populina (strain 98AG31 / pathotype 3-4-7) TaxID=747676 RepID=F4RVT5_MELLP|nr:uncharacterized protein MELLADRAFT_109233 [Melampsora larici-populina 98AG31]EGG03414.1 hypothetical protein MELLADRAFT_109233 [Melampsora larici-populina 98AG31]
MINETDSIPSLMKLSNTNYYEWSHEILAYLMTQNLDQFIQSEIKPTESELEDPHYSIRKKKTSGIIFLSLDQNNRYKIITENLLSDPLKIWLFLKEEYQSKSPSNQGRTYSKLCHLKYVNLDQFIKDTRRCLAYITACDGHKQTLDWMFAAMIVVKLPDSMESTVASLTSHYPMNTKHVLKTLEIYEANMTSHLL